jgi:hypothetical protein
LTVTINLLLHQREFGNNELYEKNNLDPNLIGVFCFLYLSAIENDYGQITFLELEFVLTCWELNDPYEL